MKTTVWFAQEGNTIFVQTVANSGKVKRIHNNERVNIAPCMMDGKIIGSWVPAQVREVTDPELCSTANRFWCRKYGLLRKMFENQRAIKGTKDSILEISLID
jgi:PPOX class probable F420-dependent enzyme